MTDLEISKALALAIGWKLSEICDKTKAIWVFRRTTPWDWVVFDYRDWNVIGPIAEKFNCFPYVTEDIFGGKHWTTDRHFSNGPTPQKAIALAVIGAM